jgi:CAAX protease family protein
MHFERCQISDDRREQAMRQSVDWRKIGLYLAFAYGISWTVALLMFVVGIPLTSGPGIAMVAIGYMPAPALGVWIVQRHIYHAPLSAYGLRIRGTRVAGLIGSVGAVWLLALGTLALVALFGNGLGWTAAGQVTGDARQIERNIAALAPGAGRPIELPNLPGAALLVVFLLGGTLSGGLLNTAFAFGEEAGWRGLLHAELAPLGRVRATLFTGVVWGLWHAPVILQGHNYPGHPWAGVVMMVVFTTAASIGLAWSREITGTIVGPSLFHGVLNAVGPLPLVFVVDANSLVGSTPGLFGSVVLTALGLLMLWTPQTPAGCVVERRVAVANAVRST